jgi:hypothetical protein
MELPLTNRRQRRVVHFGSTGLRHHRVCHAPLRVDRDVEDHVTVRGVFEVRGGIDRVDAVDDLGRPDVRGRRGRRLCLSLRLGGQAEERPESKEEGACEGAASLRRMLVTLDHGSGL